MQFIKNGPDIPDQLLQDHEDGRVVLFCGAGISYPARLPGFGGLVTRLYSELGVTPSSIERTATKSGRYDTAIGLLEGRIIGGRTTVREQLCKILSPNLSSSLATATHLSLLNLAKNRAGRYRIITTNFDHLFEEVIARESLQLQKFEAPLLPVPKNQWDGLVYLHGLLPSAPTASSLDRLVVSSGDFGRAYLTERWASRFVSELFRKYTVCFVGYSINDPVLRYMMDALAADRLLGESPAEMFAFGSYPKGKEEARADEWKAKNVTPILYREHHHHVYLHQTLQTWAAIYRDGISGKERIVVQYAAAKPLASTRQDDFIGRMLWALSDKRALPAKRFAELDPAPPLDWLEPLAKTCFGHSDLVRFGVEPDTKQDDKLTYSLLQRPTPYTCAPWMTLVHYDFAASQWDGIMSHLAHWLTRHLHDPRLILWVTKEGGTLHPEFARQVTKALERSPLSPLMQILWRLALSGRLQGRSTRSDYYEWFKRFRHEGLTPMLRLQLRDLLRPHVHLSKPFLGWEGDDQGQSIEPTLIKDIVDWEIQIGIEHVHSSMKELSTDKGWHKALPELLSEATILLRDTLDLMRELGGAEDRHDMSSMQHPSISEHPQNNDFYDWTALIDLARDAWIATSKEHPERARIEAERWMGMPYPLFRRLAFFAATDTSVVAPQQTLNWLLSDDHWWLWSLETARETLRLVVTVAPYLDDQARDSLERAILKGPPRAMFPEEIESNRLQITFDSELWLRLAKYRAARPEIGANAEAQFIALTQQYPEWRLHDDQRDEFSMWIDDGSEPQEIAPTPNRRRDLVAWLRKNPRADHWHKDDWKKRCTHSFPAAACALIATVQCGEWFTDRWRDALHAWADVKFTARTWRYLGRVLASAPDEVMKELAGSLSGWIREVARTFKDNEADFFTIIRRTLVLHMNDGIESSDDPVSKAFNHPVGHVTEAALEWWFRQDLQDGKGLSEILKPIFTQLCDTRLASFRHGRILLARNVIALFRVDQEWASLYLLPLYDWRHAAGEAPAAWKGFLGSPRLYWPLLEIIKPQFLATASHYTDLGRYGRPYVDLLTFSALEPGSIFSKTELATATRSLPMGGLQLAARALVRALEGAGMQRTEYWRNRALPYLKSIWPKSREVNTPAISGSLARLCVAAKESFPEARRELKHWLKLLTDPDFVVSQLLEMNLSQSFPEDALALLETIIDDKAQWPPSDLKACLEAIQVSSPELRVDDRLVRLRDYLRRHNIE